MASEALPPFSARNRGNVRAIDNDFPESARIGLFHIISTGVRNDYFETWDSVAWELQRISRVAPKYYGNTDNADDDVLSMLMGLPWQRVFDFCERLYSYLAQSASRTSYHVSVPLDGVRQIIADELQRLFQEENLAFEFREGSVHHRGRPHTVAQVSKADATLAVDARLDRARNHFAKAQRYFRDREKPDPENVVKEAVCAVEAAAKELFRSGGKCTLDDVVKSITGSSPGKLPGAIVKTFTGLYGFRGAGDGVAHGAATGGEATMEIAEYVLAVTASQIVLLADIARAQEEDIPF